MEILKHLVFAFPMTIAAWSASCSEWVTWSEPDTSINAVLKEGDAGLIVSCHCYVDVPAGCRSLECAPDTPPPLSILVIEPRANWKEGAEMDVVFKPDDASAQSDTAHGIAITATQVMLDQSPKVDLYTMSKAKISFTVQVGGYMRTFPRANIRAATEPVLRACGDSWNGVPE
jgi:hypothetical protein